MGIGGIGMSALAKYFRFIEKEVAGYDRTQTPLTDEMEKLGIEIHFDEGVGSIPVAFKDAAKTLVVYTPAVPNSHVELLYFQANGFQIKKRSEVLGLITKDSFCLAVAGTHGKTTTTSILAHLLAECNMSFTAFLGGISEDFNSNFVFKGEKYTVVEADEFDRSFLRLSPNIAVVTSMDADHLDIYGSHDELKNAFEDFVHKIDSNGKLILRNGLPLDGITYGIEDDSDYTMKNIKVEDGRYVFDIQTPAERLNDVKFSKPGEHNLLNALSAFAMAVEIECPTDRLVKALSTFKGVQRRFSYHIRENDFVFIDDYAHHPTEIEAVHQAVREMHPNTKVTVVFQPHLYSRTRDFVDGFAEMLAQFDEVMLLEIYPAREEPIPGVTASWLFEKIDNPNKKLVDKKDLIEMIKDCKTDILVTLGAGDIGLEVPKIKKVLAHAS